MTDITRKEIYLRAYNDITKEWQQCIDMCREYPASMDLAKKEKILFEKLSQLKIICIRYGYL